MYLSSKQSTLRLGNSHMSSPPLDPTISLLFEATKIMIPVLTGFVALFGASFGKLWEKNRSVDGISISWPIAICVVGAIVLSLAFFCGVMALCIKASTGEVQDFFWWSLSPSQAIEFARNYMAWGYSVFISAIALSAVFYFRVWRS